MPPVSPASRSSALVTWLVVFVLLWVVATVFAIYYYVDGTKSQENLTKLTDEYKEVIPAAELSGDEVTALRNKKQNDTTGKYNASMSLFDVLRTERDDLATSIGAPQPDQAAQTVQTTLANAGTQAKDAGVKSMPPTLAGAVSTLTQALVARQAEVNNLNTQLKQAQQAATQAAANMQKNQEELTKAMEAARADAQQASATLDTDRAAKDDQMKKMIADTETAQKAAQDQLAQAQSNISDLTKKLEASQRIIDDLRNKLGLKRANTADAVVRQADGAVVRVPGNNTVYINLGTGDQISPGLTFEVYDRAEGIPPAGDSTTDDNLPKGKGSIEVVRVGAGSSECRIINQEAGQVIHEGDLISNIVYDRNTKYQFFVYGDFDLDQNGVSTPQDTDVIKRLIVQWGGKVTDKINADTDFVVLGKEPTVIIPSKDEASDPIIQAKAQASQQAFDAYQDLRRQAIEYHIPILNQNRFLYYVGYYESAKR
jgi:hypothetical protein